MALARWQFLSGGSHGWLLGRWGWFFASLSVPLPGHGQSQHSKEKADERVIHRPVQGPCALAAEVPLRYPPPGTRGPGGAQNAGGGWSR